MIIVKRLILSAILLFTLLIPQQVYAEEDMLALSKDILIGTEIEKEEAATTLINRGNTDMVPSLVLLMRIGGAHVATQRALRALTSQRLTTWRDAMNYQQLHPEIAPHPSYYDLKLWYWKGIDGEFASFFESPADRAALDIRFEEITWGGGLVDSIPPLDNPTLIAPEEAGYLLDSDLVFGIEVNGDVRAYPLRIMGWHEMLNDVIGGVSVSLAYCTLCGAGILFESEIEGRNEPFIFASSGLLYRSNKLMFDRQTKSLWNQFTGKPVSGSLVASNITLNILPTVITSWADWSTKNPQTKVLSLETGFIKNYDSGETYRDYFASPDLMFPAVTDESRLLQKEYVFGIRVVGKAKAWPIKAFAKKSVINDRVGTTNIVLIGDNTTRSVRAYRRQHRVFSGDDINLKSQDNEWQITEDALIGPNQEILPRVPGHVAYWFAWDGYLGAKSELYQPLD